MPKVKNAKGDVIANFAYTDEGQKAAQNLAQQNSDLSIDYSPGGEINSVDRTQTMYAGGGEVGYSRIGYEDGGKVSVWERNQAKRKKIKEATEKNTRKWKLKKKLAKANRKGRKWYRKTKRDERKKLRQERRDFRKQTKEVSKKQRTSDYKSYSSKVKDIRGNKSLSIYERNKKLREAQVEREIQARGRRKKYTKAERKGPKKSTEVPKDWIEYQKAMDKTILERDESGA